jgi:chaperonin GroEL
LGFGSLSSLASCREALTNFFAFSVSSLMTTTEAVVTDLPKDVKDAPAMGPGMGMDY